MDLKQIFKLRSMWNSFTKTHPKFPAFLSTIASRGVGEGTNIEVTFTYPDGTKIKGGIIVQPSDLELFNSLVELSKMAK